MFIQSHHRHRTKLDTSTGLHLFWQDTPDSARAASLIARTKLLHPVVVVRLPPFEERCFDRTRRPRVSLSYRRRLSNALVHKASELHSVADSRECACQLKMEQRRINECEHAKNLTLRRTGDVTTNSEVRSHFFLTPLALVVAQPSMSTTTGAPPPRHQHKDRTGVEMTSRQRSAHVWETNYQAAWSSSNQFNKMHSGDSVHCIAHTCGSLGSTASSRHEVK